MCPRSHSESQDSLKNTTSVFQFLSQPYWYLRFSIYRNNLVINKLHANKFNFKKTFKYSIYSD